VIAPNINLFNRVGRGLNIHFQSIIVHRKGKGKAILGQALWVPGGWGPQISRHLAHIGSKVVNPSTSHLYPSGNISGIHFC